MDKPYQIATAVTPLEGEIKMLGYRQHRRDRNPARNRIYLYGKYNCVCSLGKYWFYHNV